MGARQRREPLRGRNHRRPRPLAQNARQVRARASRPPGGRRREKRGGTRLLSFRLREPSGPRSTTPRARRPAAPPGRGDRAHGANPRPRGAARTHAGRGANSHVRRSPRPRPARSPRKSVTGPFTAPPSRRWAVTPSPRPSRRGHRGDGLTPGPSRRRYLAAKDRSRGPPWPRPPRARRPAATPGRGDRAHGANPRPRGPAQTPTSDGRRDPGPCDRPESPSPGPSRRCYSRRKIVAGALRGPGCRGHGGPRLRPGEAIGPTARTHVRGARRKPPRPTVAETPAHAIAPKVRHRALHGAAIAAMGRDAVTGPFTAPPPRRRADTGPFAALLLAAKDRSRGPPWPRPPRARRPAATPGRGDRAHGANPRPRGAETLRDPCDRPGGPLPGPSRQLPQRWASSRPSRRCYRGDGLTPGRCGAATAAKDRSRGPPWPRLRRGLGLRGTVRARPSRSPRGSP